MCRHHYNLTTKTVRRCYCSQNVENAVSWIANDAWCLSEGRISATVRHFSCSFSPLVMMPYPSPRVPPPPLYIFTSAGGSLQSAPASLVGSFPAATISGDGYFRPLPVGVAGTGTDGLRSGLRSSVGRQVGRRTCRMELSCVGSEQVITGHRSREDREVTQVVVTSTFVCYIF